MKRWVPVAAVAAGPVVLAGVGLTHPTLLTVESAPWWTTMHLLLLPLFPLLAVAVWVLLRKDRTAIGWGGRVAAAIFTALYVGLDAVSGVAAGTVVQAGAEPGTEVVDSLFVAGRPLGVIGAYALFVAVILVLGSAWRRGARGALFFVGAAALLTSGYLFTTSHIYWPKGVGTMIGFTIGFTLIELALQRAEARVTGGEGAKG